MRAPNHGGSRIYFSLSQNQCYSSKEIGSRMHTVTQNLVVGVGVVSFCRHFTKYASLFERRVTG
jgi:hypothetical protein